MILSKEIHDILAKNDDDTPIVQPPPSSKNRKDNQTPISEEKQTNEDGTTSKDNIASPPEPVEANRKHQETAIQVRAKA